MSDHDNAKAQRSRKQEAKEASKRQTEDEIPRQRAAGYSGRHLGGKGVNGGVECGIERTSFRQISLVLQMQEWRGKFDRLIDR